MTDVLIKICGIQDPELAYQAGIKGADFIGLVFEKNSKRYIDPKQAESVADAAKSAGAIPVAVFTHHCADEMLTICLANQITHVQLHGEDCKQQHRFLPDSYRRIYVNTVLNSRLMKDPQPLFCIPERDFLLFDHYQSGQGQNFDWDHFNYEGDFKFGIAGGLNCDNVKTVLNRFKPTFVDVSSGVENTPGRKQLALIEHFIQIVKSN
jgi:phosphoribosylanthranilate isomerase